VKKLGLWRGSSETVAKPARVHVRTGYQARPAPPVVEMNSLRLNPPDHVTCDGSDDSSPLKASEICNSLK
jgi:hypothetical protein